MSFDLFPYLTSIAFIYIYGRLANHFAPKIYCYFLNESIVWQKQIEKPRIFLHLIGLSFMHLMVYSNSSIEITGLLIQFITWLTFILGFFACQFTWTKKFEATFTPQLKRSTARSSENFNLSISDLQLIQLYNELVRFDLLNQDLTTVEDFNNVLLKDWKEHNSKLHLKMDGPSCREFYEYFIRTYPNNSLTMKNLFVTSKLVLRADGKSYNYNTIKNAPIRTAVSKHNESLIKIFRKLS
ncbi:hypothetical protein RM549_11075 [Salegentibacter sp. F188]|uniref:HTH LytTR-type domain-containing protein n=1 Tax=Autumnicola patrickiae TaxID=3075591 RepID=A0ABU3E323_9FLAO|nr:hypothetical protein [Salegentibacter sp. F188]MDT0690330.1 hypothetical protein [Salegentibacter sp. F188]